MTVSITADDIKEVYSTSGLSDLELSVFADIGNMVVNEQIVGTTCGDKLSSDRLDKIAVYVACHFAEVSANSDVPGPIKTDKIGDALTSYASPDQARAGYMSSRWGQLALTLDTCNLLVSAARLKALFQVVGDNHIGAGVDY